jgi:dipeptidyl aminopeptidase/acylaminoacyl peptidase
LRHSELDAISPADHAENFQAPVLLLHGEHDEVVSNKQSGKMYSRLKSAGKDVTYVPLEDDNHYLSSDETRIQALREVIDFVNEKLR